MVCTTTANQHGYHGGEVARPTADVEERGSGLDVQSLQCSGVDARGGEVEGALPPSTVLVRFKSLVLSVRD